MNRQKIASIVLSAAILSGAAATQVNNVVHASNISVSCKHKQ
ncbi:hypothetical protein [Clostridium sp. Marseille-Q2269]|nr:hypothetical protein [Clostridium sp. Marseille-Q2269]